MSPRSLFAVSAILCALAAPCAAAPLHWLRAESPRFVLYAQADQDSILRLANSLDGMARVLELDGFGARSEARLPMVLIGFGIDAEFRRALPLVHGVRPDAAGLNSTHSYGSWIAFLLNTRSGRRIAHHEFLHTIVDGAIGNAPPCMNEGLAEFYSTFDLAGRTCTFGDVIEEHCVLLRKTKPMPLDTLFAIGYDSPSYRQGAARDLFYAESWALTHYLARLPGFARRYREWAKSITEGSAPRAAFREQYPELDWDSIPRDLVKYVQSDAYHQHEMTLSGELSPTRFVVRSAGAGEVESNTGLFRAGSDDGEYTRSLFAIGRRSLADAGFSDAGLGLDDVFEQRIDSAIVHCRAAIAASGPSARTLALAGAGLATIASHQAGLIDEAFAALERSINQDSLDACALAWYGRASVLRRNVTPRGVRALAMAFEALPVDRNVALNYATALDQTGDHAGAQEVLASNRNFADLGRALDLRVLEDSVTSALLRGDVAGLEPMFDAFVQSHPDTQSVAAVERMREAVRAIPPRDRQWDNFDRSKVAWSEGRLTEARDLLTAVRDSTEDSNLRKFADETLANMPAYFEYERGLKAAREGKYAAAKVYFERVLRIAKAPELRDEAREKLEQLRKVQRR